MFESNRTTYENDAVPFPATKSAGALTIEGTMVAPYKDGAFGHIDAVIKASDSTKITNTVEITANVSYDNGETWKVVKRFTEMANGTDPISVVKDAIIEYAPSIRLDATFDATGALASGHGCQISVRSTEAEPLLRRHVFPEALYLSRSIDDEIGNNSVIYSDAMSVVMCPEACYGLIKVAVASSCEYPEEITDNVTWVLQSSYDGINWFDASAVQTDLANDTVSTFAEVVITNSLGKYARIKLETDATGVIAPGAIIVFDVILFF